MKNLITILSFISLFSFTNLSFADNSQPTNAEEVVLITGIQMANQAASEISQISVEEFKSSTLLTGTVVLDIRDGGEFNSGAIPNAINISRGMLEFKVTTQIPNAHTPIIVYCKTGKRGALATKTLLYMGYTNVQNLDGGYEAYMKSFVSIP